MEIKAAVRYKEGYKKLPATRAGVVQVVDDDGRVLVEYVAWREEDRFFDEERRLMFSVPGFGKHKAPEVTQEQAEAILRLAKLVKEAVLVGACCKPVRVDGPFLNLNWYDFREPKLASAVEEARQAAITAFGWKNEGW